MADIELSKDEDSVTTLAVASSTDTALTAIAGINSSVAEQEAGKNEHLRTFRIALPRKRKADGSPVEQSEKPQKIPAPTLPLGKTALFKSAHGPKNDTYQRVLRASPVQSAGEARIMAIASGLAPENEVIAFQPVANALTSAVDEISRISLGKSEAADVDVMGVKDNGHILAYCTDDEIFLQKLPTSKGSKIEKPMRVYQCPETDSTTTSQRSKFRALRMLTPKHILFLQNRPGRSGAGLGILKLNQDDSNGQVTLWKKLTKSTKSAVGLDACALTESQSGQRQFIIAVAGQDSTIEILTLNYINFAGFGTFKPYTILRDVHSGPLTRLTFSNFVGPSFPVSKDTPPQYIRLASVGVDQTVVVHHLALQPYPTTLSDTPSYVLVPPGRSETTEVAFSAVAAIICASIAAILLQAFCEIRGAVPPHLGAPNWLSSSMRDRFYVPYNHTYYNTPPESSKTSEASDSSQMSEALSSHIAAMVDAPSRIPLPSVENVQDTLSDIVAENSQLETPKAIVMRDTGSGLTAELHQDADVVKEETLKKWDDLSEHQKHGWKQRLMDAGHWAEQQGETVLKGILFTELAAAMG